MIKPEVLDALVAAGCTAEQIAAAVKADQARSTNAERQARFRARRKASQSNEHNVTSVTVTDTPSPKKEIPPTPPKEKTTPSPISSVGSARDREFSEFWSIFPNKVGKRDAGKAFDAARQRASFEDIMAGLRRYAAKTDDRPWCNPTTFLNQDRWTDEPAASVPSQPRSGAPPPQREPRNPGERAFLKLQHGLDHEPPSQQTGRLGSGDGQRQAEGPGILRRYAGPTLDLSRTG